MSSPNAETVRRLYDGWARGDFAVDMDAFDPAVEFEMTWGPDRIASRGLDGMAAAWRGYLRVWQDFTTGSIEELVEEGDTIAVLNRIRGRGKHSNVPVEHLNAAVFTFRDGRIVRLVLTTPEEAMAAVGRGL
ncbi:MAG: nuclear transport factor 2 family protein [Actinomycetota bacterium]|nr:nuclear transport factor 2 family protein [Actinomycetota bacterium]